jgi:hypothetical protein
VDWRIDEVPHGYDRGAATAWTAPPVAFRASPGAMVLRG